MYRLYTFLVCLREGIDYYGGDIFAQRGENAKQCAVICEKDEDCKKWVYVTKPEFGDCILMKGGNISLYPNKYRISGFQNSKADICGENGNNLDLQWNGIQLHFLISN